MIDGYSKDFDSAFKAIWN